MKRALCLTILLALILFPAALGEAHRTVEPMSAALDLSNLPDGIYPVGFDRANLSDGTISHAHLFTVEDVLTEFGIDWEHESDCEDRAALLKEYAAKLQLREDA